MNNYIKPVTRIVAVATQQMVALSSVNLTDGSQDNTAALGKEGFFGWEEEEDEEPMGMPGYNVWED